VGAGKTLVALSAMLLAVEAGFQAALMAPTQILAEQHYLQFQRLCTPLGIRVGLRTGNRKEESGPLPLFDHDRWQQAIVSGNDGDRPPPPPAAPDEPDILVGTHALLFESSEFEKLGLVVIDEQHKFGVLQRTKLIERADAPDVLVMTATPIPRTITQTLYGDLDVSILKNRPAGRGRIVTAVRDVERLPSIVDFLRGELAAGRQAYIVYPLIEESEKLDVKAATAEFEKWRTLLAPATVGIVHGRIDAEAKEAVMRDFREGRLSVLVATTVIEVGVDVPNATIMIIEEAGRFGLSQMHQLRGRIGRGPEKSWCILLHDGATGPALEKLEVLEKTSDGFEIAEADLRLRGPGDILGTAQSGLTDLRFADFITDTELIRQARSLADQVFKDDPDLSRLHANLRPFISESTAPQGAH
jgi:ATP-dependent DNA helicase RecG